MKKKPISVLHCHSEIILIVILIDILLDGTSEVDRIIKDVAFDYLFGSPELLVGDSAFKDQLHAFDVSTIVVDVGYQMLINTRVLYMLCLSCFKYKNLRGAITCS